MGNRESWWVFPGFEIDVVVTGLDLPVNLAFVPNPGKDALTPAISLPRVFTVSRVFCPITQTGTNNANKTATTSILFKTTSLRTSLQNSNDAN